jgi:hypothetical protein
MSDVIRLARHAHHYLAIFDRGKAIGLYHTKRLASPGQRIVLYAPDVARTNSPIAVIETTLGVQSLLVWFVAQETLPRSPSFSLGAAAG